MGWFLAPALEVLREQIDDMYANRDRSSDGSIGDTSHSARVSDHNPDWDANGIVRAIDVTNKGIPNLDALLAFIIADKRTRYVISRGKIWDVVSRKWVTYTGANRHDKHFHVSIRNVSGYDLNSSRWVLNKEIDNVLSKDDVERIAKRTAELVWATEILSPSNLVKELGETASAKQMVRAIAFRTEAEYRQKD